MRLFFATNRVPPNSQRCFTEATAIPRPRSSGTWSNARLTRIPLVKILAHVVMQSHWNAPSRRISPPDIVRPPQITSSARPLSPPSPHPEFLIVGLFALRLTKRLIQGLEYYPGRDDDIAWLANFVAPYPIEFALAKISGQRKEDYTATYQDIVSRMKRQSRYPVRFMQMSPDQPMRHQQVSRGIEREGPREMTDRESSSELATPGC
jgi:hypothetical protein